MARPRSDIRPRLIQAARERFLEEGVDGTSLRSVAEDARTNLGMVVYYFPTKVDLFAAVLEPGYTRLLDELAAALRPGPEPRERLRFFLRRLTAVNEDERQILRLVIRETLGSAARRHQLLERVLREHVPILLGLVDEGARTGLFKPLNGEALAETLLEILMNGIAGPRADDERARGRRRTRDRRQNR